MLMTLVEGGRYIVEHLWIETCLVMIAIIANTHLHQFIVSDALVIEPGGHTDVRLSCIRSDVLFSALIK